VQKGVGLTASPVRTPSFGWVGRTLPHIVLLILTFTSLMPFVWMFFGSFKSYVELTSSTALLPVNWTFDNYVQITQRVGFPRAFLNTTLVAIAITLATLLTSSLAGYVFAKYRFWGKEQLFTVLLATLMVPFAVVLVPLYVTVANLGMADKLAGIIVTALCSTFGIFLMRQFMESIPNDLIDAGRIDGAGEWWIFSRVVLPLAKAPLSALAVFTFLGSWDSFLWPLVVLTSPENQTLPLVLAGLRSLYWSRYELYAAGSMLTVLPVMILYAFASKQFVRGIAMTGIKA
jgi:multiple sugar transport system permease protein